MLKKGILLLVLSSLIMFSVSCGPEHDTIYRTWGCASVLADGASITDIWFTINEDASYSWDYRWNGNHTQTGTLAPANLPENKTITATIVTSSFPWPFATGGHWYFRYSDPTINSPFVTEVEMEFDFSGNGFEGPYTFYRIYNDRSSRVGAAGRFCANGRFFGRPQEFRVVGYSTRPASHRIRCLRANPAYFF